MTAQRTPELQALTGEAVFTGDSMVEGHAFLVDKGGKIVDIVSSSRIPDGARASQHPGMLLAPGFIDCQVNGGGGVLFNETPVPEAVKAIAMAHLRRGTTRLLPTCTSDTREVMQQALAAVRAVRNGCPSVIGVHLEGPHISREKRGAHGVASIRSMDKEDIAAYRPQGGETVLVTLAPETVAAEDILALVRHGNVVSLGHTTATAEQARAALAAGARGFTHLFNVMSGLAAREPGATGVALDADAAWCGLIADGHHVDDALIRLAFKAKGRDKIVLVSDAMPPSACENPGPFMFYGRQVACAGGKCVDTEGRLAGSASTLAECVRYAITRAGIDPEDALRAASASAAEFLGLGDRLGKLLPGYPADIVALDPQDFTIRAAWQAGVPVASLSLCK